MLTEAYRAPIAPLNATSSGTMAAAIPRPIAKLALFVCRVVVRSTTEERQYRRNTGHQVSLPSEPFQVTNDVKRLTQTDYRNRSNKQERRSA